MEINEGRKLTVGNLSLNMLKVFTMRFTEEKMVACGRLHEHGTVHTDQLETAWGMWHRKNPDWVEWLMGWPIGWTSLEPMTELVCLDWEIDPAETDCRELWTTPGSSDIYSKTNTPRKSRKHIGIKSEYLSRQSVQWPGIGPIPRIGTNIKDRINRLKAIGNGQVPQCVKMAWERLTGNVFFPRPPGVSFRPLD